MPHRCGLLCVLTRVQAAYAEGVPSSDYPALLVTLQRYLPVEDVLRVATELTVRGVSSLTGVNLRAALPNLIHEVKAVDIARVVEILGGQHWAETPHASGRERDGTL